MKKKKKKRRRRSNNTAAAVKRVKHQDQQMHVQKARVGKRGLLHRLHHATTQLYSHDTIVRDHDDLVTTGRRSSRLVRIRVRRRVPALHGRAAAVVVGLW